MVIYINNPRGRGRKNITSQASLSYTTSTSQDLYQDLVTNKQKQNTTTIKKPKTAKYLPFFQKEENATTQIKHENIMLHEIRLPQKDNYYTTLHRCGIQSTQIQRQQTVAGAARENMQQFNRRSFRKPRVLALCGGA